MKQKKERNRTLGTTEKEMNKEINEKVKRVIDKLTDENLAKTFAYYSNQSKIIEPYEENDEEFLFLLEVTKVLSGFIVEKYMKESGFYQSDEDEFGLWEHE